VDLTEQYMTVGEAASLAKRSKTTIRFWIREGWIPDSQVVSLPGPNGAWLIERTYFKHHLPGLLEEMSKRKGGRGRRAPNGHGVLRGA
jgi:hypothetical protein